MVFHKFIEKYLLVFYRIYGDSGKKEARSGGGETTPATGTERHPAVVVRFCIAGRGLVHTGIRRLLFHLLEQRPGCRQVRAGVRATQDPVSNWGGKLGAVTANYIVGEWFGLFGICIPIVLIVLSLRIMRYRPMLLRKSVRLMLVLMILGSLALGYIFGDAWGVFGTGLGGAHGLCRPRA